MEGPRREKDLASRILLRRAACALIAFGLIVVPAISQDVAGSPAPRQSAGPQPRLASERTALTLSLIGSLIPVGLIALMSLSPDEDFGIPGLYIPMALTLFAGSSAGYFYGGCWGRGLLTAGLRLGATYLVVAYVLEHDEDDNGTLALTYLAGTVGSIIWDLATVKKAVRKRNQTRLAKRGLSVDVAPFAAPKGGGVRLRLSF